MCHRVNDLDLLSCAAVRGIDDERRICVNLVEPVDHPTQANIGNRRQSLADPTGYFQRKGGQALSQDRQHSRREVGVTVHIVWIEPSCKQWCTAIRVSEHDRRTSHRDSHYPGLAGFPSNRVAIGCRNRDRYIVAIVHVTFDLETLSSSGVTRRIKEILL